MCIASGLSISNLAALGDCLMKKNWDHNLEKMVWQVVVEFNSQISSNNLQ
jgi:hypothetical protein